ncbi:MAG: hypothetical protein MAG453_00983 [Calditrichaeota bacterium]|nr:hypothetical protein [Calditrichota bacterium]
MQKNVILSLALLLLAAGCGEDNAANVEESPGTLEIPEGRLTIAVDGVNVSVPMIANRDLDAVHPDVDRALLVVPSGTREIVYPYGLAADLAAEEQVAGTTLIFGLQFLDDCDVVINEPGDDVLYWGQDKWSYGYENDVIEVDGRSVQVSSFSVIDSAITRVLRACPNLRALIMTGNSAGGTGTHHYAAATALPEQYPDVGFGFVTQNAVTWLYFTPERIVPGTDSEFAVPPADSIESCPRYDLFPSGIVDPPDYLSRYDDELIRQRYRDRFAVYLIGSGDDTDYDNCRLLLQGEDNLHRCINYYAYLEYLFGDAIHETQHLEVIQGAGHAIRLMIPSDAARYALFHWIPGQRYGFEG